jgi:large subunit ribosomal protein L24
MNKVKYLDIKKGDLVVVIAGKDKGKQGKVLKTIPEEGKVIVEGVNMQTHFQERRTNFCPQGNGYMPALPHKNKSLS